MLKLLEITPSAAVPGGELFLRWSGNDTKSYLRPEVCFSRAQGHLVFASSELIVVKVPEEAASGEIYISMDGQQTNRMSCEVAALVTGNVHPVSNPAIDLEGNLYTTMSGRRGEKVANSLYRIASNGLVQPLSAELMNPTGIAFNSRGEMVVSSRFDGNIYKVTPQGERSLYAKGMGVATGIAFDYNDDLYVGDRTGTIFKIDKKRDTFVFATLEPSVAAYHLAFDEDQNLFVAGPTTSSFDSLYKITPEGNVSTFYSGLGRPQGMAFDIEGNLLVAASLGGRHGIVRINRKGEARLAVSGNGLVGLAFAYPHGIFLASHNSIYKVNLNVIGKPMP